MKPFSWDPFSKLNFCLKIARIVANIFAKKFPKFVKISLEFVDIRADFHQNFTKSCRINKKLSDSTSNCCGKLWNFVKVELALS